MLTSIEPMYTLHDHDVTLQAREHEYVLKVRDMPDAERPREKLLANGPASLNLAELTAIIWGVGSRKEDVLAMAKRTLREYGEQAIMHSATPQQLAEAADIPLTKACQLVAGMELGRRFYSTSRRGQPLQVRTTSQAYEYLHEMGAAQKEQLRGLYLDSRYQVIHDEIISLGSLTANIVHPREVFQPAIERGAVAIIIAHNHPSGVLEPTEADIAVTRQLVAAGTILGIELLDHLIITATHHQSIMEEL